jgi:small membrane protein
MISLILSVVLGAAFVGGLLIRKTAPSVGISMVIASAIGIYFAWVPDDLSRIARFLGVGRGADLLLYIWVVVSFLALVALMLRLRLLNEQLTELARKLALATARPPATVDSTGDKARPT